MLDQESAFVDLVRNRLDADKAVKINIIADMYGGDALLRRSKGLCGIGNYDVVCEAIVNENERIGFHRHLGFRNLSEETLETRKNWETVSVRVAQIQEERLTDALLLVVIGLRGYDGKYLPENAAVVHQDHCAQNIMSDDEILSKFFR